MQNLRILSMDLKKSNNLLRCSRKQRSVEGRIESISSWIRNDATSDPFSIIMLQGRDAQKIGLRVARGLNYSFYAASDNPSSILVRKNDKVRVAALRDVADFGNCVVVDTEVRSFLALFSVMIKERNKAKEFSDIFKEYTNPYSTRFTKSQLVSGVFSSREDVEAIADNYHLMDLSLEEKMNSCKSNSFVNTILLSTEVGYTDVKKEDALVKQRVLKNSPMITNVYYK